ncbi:MAG: MFS transporter [Bacteroidota bacterium]
MHIKKHTQLFSIQPYRNFALSGLLGTFGNGFMCVTVSWYITTYHNKLSYQALNMLCIWLPDIVFSPIFGILADRLNRKFLIVLSNFARGLLLLTYYVIITLYIQQDAISNVYILSALLGTFAAMYMPASMGILKEVISSDDLLSANTMLNTIYEFGTVLGNRLCRFFY